MEFKDYYSILGVPKTASREEIRAAYRALARKYHPDVAEDKTTAEAKFKEINEAYEVLGDPAKRRQYDEISASWSRGGPFRAAGGAGRAAAGGAPGGFTFEEFDFGGSTGFSSFFEQFFGRGAAGFESFFGGEPAAAPVRATRADLMVTMPEAIHGAQKTITLQTPGAPPRSFNVKLPPGIYDGQQIRLAGQGAGGGDLLLIARIAPHPDFRREGEDLVAEVGIPAWMAVLGGAVTIDTLDGRRRLNIPPGTSSGKRFRLPGHGLPRRSGGRGDLHARIEVIVPQNPGPQERALWEQLARLDRR